MSIVYGLQQHDHLGDLWMLTQWLEYKATIEGNVSHLNPVSNGVDHSGRLIDIMNELSITKIRLVYDAPNTFGRFDYAMWQIPYMPTTRRWKFAESHEFISYQIDGNWLAEDKNPSQQEGAAIIDFLRGLGIPPVKLGKPIPIEQIVSFLIRSRLFVGVDSGMAHIAHSVGVPVFLLEYKYSTDCAHYGKAFRRCHGLDGLKYSLSLHNTMLEFMKHPDHFNHLL